MKDNKSRVVILALIAVVVLLLGFVGYSFVLKPSLTGLVVGGQNQGYIYAVAMIMQQAAQCKQVPLTLGNQTINLVAVECLDQAAQQG